MRHVKRLILFFSISLFYGLAAATSVWAQDQFNDAFGGTAIDSHWQAVNGAVTAPGLVTDAATLPSNDGKVAALYGNQTLLASGTEEWKSVTTSVSILPLTATDSMQGIILAASKGFSNASTDAFFLVSFDRSASFTAVHVYGNGKDVAQAYPGPSLAGWLVPGNPHDGAYHELKAQVIRDNVSALLTVWWDGTLLGSVPADSYWNLRAPFGRIGLFTYQRSSSDETRFDDFKATWNDTPAAVAPLGVVFTDPFPTGALDTHWFTTKSDDSLAAPSVVSNGGTLPSNDGQVLQVAGGQVMLVRGSENWLNTTISCYILPSSDPNLSLQGIIGAVGSGFNFSKYDSYFYASFLRYGGQSFVRLGFNGGDSTTAFPGSSMDGSVPGTPLDGLFHKLTLKINRDNINPIWTVLWDDQQVITWGPDSFWSARAPYGRVGVFTYYRSGAETLIFDQFVAQNDDLTPVELSEFAAQ
jgi:hypothetical protein